MCSRNLAHVFRNCNIVQRACGSVTFESIRSGPRFIAVRYACGSGSCGSGSRGSYNLSGSGRLRLRPVPVHPVHWGRPVQAVPVQGAGCVYIYIYIYIYMRVYTFIVYVCIDVCIQ